ncbi:MAG: hypothetical protein JWM88_3064 [Verrucomicrobia bacterium]|nr:hypothetical protein [Verrucomicrobiota bacterium]
MRATFPSERTWCVALFGGCLALNLWFSSTGLRNNLLEGHEFRQAQTALAARHLQADGWQLAYPLPLFGPPWSAPMEFPFYEYLAATVSRVTHAPLEPSGRFVSLFFFYLSLPAFFMAARDAGMPSHRRWLFLGALVLSPAYAYYSRAFMIESTALCASAWFLLAYLRSLHPRANRWLAAAMVLGIVAALAKVTTLIVFLAAAALYTLAQLIPRMRAAPDRWQRLRPIAIRALLATLPAVVAGALWVAYSDRIKLSNPLSTFLASGPMAAFNFGTLAQRFSPTFWAQILTHTCDSILPGFALAVVLTFGLLRSGDARRRTALLILAYLAGPLIFANLFFVHDYYFYASGVFLLLALAVSWSQLLDVPEIPTAGKWCLILVCLATEAHEFAHGYFRLQGTRPEPPTLARAISTVTAPDDVILIYGFEWNPVLPYYAERRAVMVPSLYAGDRRAVDEVLRRLPAGRIGALVVAGEYRRNPALISSLAASLDLTPRAVIASNDGEVYLARRLVPDAARVLQNMKVSGFTFALPEDPVVPGVGWSRYYVEQLPDHSFFDMMTPLPVEVRAAFGLSCAVVEGRRVFNAHAPCELIFAVQRDTRTIRAEYGVVPEAYENGHQLAGVRFLVELVQANGDHATLLDTFLDPTRVAADRGVHHADLRLPAHEAGRLILSTLPGKEKNISFNWAYWTSVMIR